MLSAIVMQKRVPRNGLLRFANFLEVAGIAVWATVIATTTPITVMLATVKALVDVTKGKSGRFCATVRAVTKLLIV